MSLTSTEIPSQLTKTILPTSYAGNQYDLNGPKRVVNCKTVSFYHMYSYGDLTLESGILVLYDSEKYNAELHGPFVRLTNAPYAADKYLKFLGYAINKNPTQECNLPTEGVHYPLASKSYDSLGKDGFVWTQELRNESIVWFQEILGTISSYNDSTGINARYIDPAAPV